MNFRFLSLAIILHTLHVSQAQKVESAAYNFMLKRILSHAVPAVSVNEVDANRCVLLDARELIEFNVSTIRGARWVGFEDFSMTRVEDIDKDSKIIVYCSVGYRSEKIAEKLIEAGFKDVSNLYGGIFEWVNQEKEVFDSLDYPVVRVHAFSRLWDIWLHRGKKVYE